MPIEYRCKSGKRRQSKGINPNRITRPPVHGLEQKGRSCNAQDQHQDPKRVPLAFVDQENEKPGYGGQTGRRPKVSQTAHSRIAPEKIIFPAPTLNPPRRWLA